MTLTRISLLALLAISTSAFAADQKPVRFACDNQASVVLEITRNEKNEVVYVANTQPYGKLAQIDCSTLDQSFLRYGDNVCLSNEKALFVTTAGTKRASIHPVNNDKDSFARSGFCTAKN